MPPRGIRGAAPAPSAKGRGRGGGGRGAGRKPIGVNAPGADAGDAPKRKQQSLGDLLGERFAKKPKTIADAVGARAPGGSGSARYTRILHMDDEHGEPAGP